MRPDLDNTKENDPPVAEAVETPEAVETTEQSPSPLPEPMQSSEVAATEIEAPTGLANSSADASVPVNNAAAEPPKKDHKKLAIILFAVVVLLMGGSVGAYQLWYQSPNKVLSDGLVNLLTNTSPAEYAVNFAIGDGDAFKMAVKGMSSTVKEVSSVEGTLSIGSEQMKDIKLKGAFVYASGTTYFKVSDIKKVVNDIVEAQLKTVEKEYKASNNYQLTEADKQMVRSMVELEIAPTLNKLDNQWVKVTAEDLKGQSADSARQYQCAVDAYSQLRDKKNVQEVTNIYKKNPFLSVTKELGSKDGSFGYEITVNKTKNDEFGKQFENTAVAKSFNKCDDSASKDKEKSNDTTTTKSFQLWISQLSHQITRIVYSGDVKDADGKSVTIEADITKSKEKPTSVTIPTDAKSISDIVKEADGLTGNGTSSEV